jgi:RNA polymerase sigma-70 factor (ECF subfamily)
MDEAVSVDAVELDWSEIYLQYSQRIYNYLYRRTSNTVLSEDMTADVFVKAMLSEQGGGGPTTSLSGWLFRIAHNMVIDEYRARKRHKPWLSFDDCPQVADPKHDPEEYFDRLSAAEVLWGAMMKLCDSQAEVLQMRFLEGMEYEEIGQRIGRSEGAVKALQHRGLGNMYDLITNTKPKKEPSCVPEICEALRLYGPMKHAEICKVTGESSSRVTSAIKGSQRQFCIVDTYPFKGRLGYVWGVAGIHDKVAA